MTDIKYDYRCWITGEGSCDGKCDSIPYDEWGDCGYECEDCSCKSCYCALPEYCHDRVKP